MKKFTIYKITNLQGCVYIGKTTDIVRRLRSHRNKNHYKNSPLTMSVKEDGWNSHSVEVLEEFMSDECYADGKEIFWIRSYMSNRNKWPEHNGLNLTNGGSGCNGHKGAFKGEKRPDGVGAAISIGRYKRVYQYSLNGKLLKEHVSGLHAAKELGVTNKMISAAALGKRNTCKGYILKYA